jgi:hypothetical protein
MGFLTALDGGACRSERACSSSYRGLVPIKVKTVDELLSSVESDVDPPAGLTPLILSLWLAKKGRWGASHEVAQDIHESDGSWVHAYLHRVEGDIGNARYWYSRAGKPAKGVDDSLDQEWREIAATLLGDQAP